MATYGPYMSIKGSWKDICYHMWPGCGHIWFIWSHIWPTYGSYRAIYDPYVRIHDHIWAAFRHSWAIYDHFRPHMPIHDHISAIYCRVWPCMFTYDHIWSYDQNIMSTWSTKNPKTKLNCRLEKRNVGDRLKRVLAKFQTHRSYFDGVNGCSKIAKLRCIRRRKIKCRGSSETRFGQVSGQSELFFEGKRPFKVSTRNRNRPFLIG